MSTAGDGAPATRGFNALRVVVQTMAGLVIICGLLAVQALALYLTWWIAMIVVSYVPLVGRKYGPRNGNRLDRIEE